MPNPTTIAGLPFTFQGQFIIGLSTALGWNTSPSSVNLTVVEKKTETEKGPAAFAGSTIGSLQIGKFFSLSLGSFSFGGLLRSRRYTEDTGGKKWQVTLVDPRELMKNTIVLVAPSDGTIKSFGGRRVIDIFNTAGGLFASGWTATGMPWSTIATVLGLPTVSAMEGLVDVFKVDVSELTAKMDPDFRISGNMLTLAELLQQAATAAAVDWFVETSATTNPTVKLKVVDRSTDDETISLQSFAAQFGYDTVNSRVKNIQVGKEWRNETGCAILQSSNFEFLDNRSPTTTGLPKLDLSFEGFGLFLPSEKGMRAALAEQKVWEFYMERFHKKESEDGELPEFFNSLYSFDHLESLDIAVEKAIAQQDTPPPKNPNYYARQKSKDNTPASEFAEYKKNVAIVKIAYEKYRDYANKFYGKVFVYYDDNIIPEVFEEIGGAFTRSIGNKDGLPSVVAQFFEDTSGEGKQVVGNEEDTKPGKTRPVAAFDNVTIENEGESNIEIANKQGKIIFDGQSPQDFIFNEGTLYVAASTSNGLMTINPLWQESKDKFEEFPGITLEDDFVNGKQLGSKEDFKNLIENGKVNLKVHRKAIEPDGVWIPLRNKLVFWKTWRSSICGPNALRVEQDGSLDPANYGSFTLMDIAGQQKVDRMGSEQFEADRGSVQVEGIPEKKLGSSVGLNSHITSIGITFGIGGALTTYTLQSFTPRFGETSKDQLDQMALLGNKIKSDIVKNNERLLQNLSLAKVHSDALKDF